MADLIVLEKPTPSQADTTPAQGQPVAPINYVNTFSPDSAQYSVNTGNASVRQLEDIRANFSPPPQILPAPPDDTKYLYGFLIAFIFIYFSKGKIL